ncbi:MAG: indole-3-glycerol phosphate synthase TrpC [Bacteroides sp.]|nr:indole-3-glycerol phosphate synthase TrpC [Bacteroides sp.]
MKDILNEIVAHKRIEVARQQEAISMKLLRDRLHSDNDLHRPVSMKQALKESPHGIIAEFKRRSPSKGWIRQEADARLLPPAYEAAGASALSILTDETFFGGSLRDLSTARPLVSLPILRKDFVIDAYQLYQARVVGADAVLLIAACLSPVQCREFTALAHELGLEVLLEVHSEEELAYITPEVDMIGINNRHLGTFHTDVENSFRLAGLLPKERVLVSESGIARPETLARLRMAGFRGFLIGETFMKSEAPDRALQAFITAIPTPDAL